MRTIIDGTTGMRGIPRLDCAFYDGRRTGSGPSQHECLHLLRGNKAHLVAPEMIISAFRQNFVNVSPNLLIRCQCRIGATRCRWRRGWRGRGGDATTGTKKATHWRAAKDLIRLAYSGQLGAVLPFNWRHAQTDLVGRH